MSNNIFLNNNLDEQLLNKIFFTLINEDKRNNPNATIDEEFIEPIVALSVNTSL